MHHHCKFWRICLSMLQHRVRDGYSTVQYHSILTFVLFRMLQPDGCCNQTKPR